MNSSTFAVRLLSGKLQHFVVNEFTTLTDIKTHLTVQGQWKGNVKEASCGIGHLDVLEQIKPDWVYHSGECTLVKSASHGFVITPQHCPSEDTLVPNSPDGLRSVQAQGKLKDSCNETSKKQVAESGAHWGAGARSNTPN